MEQPLSPTPLSPTPLSPTTVSPTTVSPQQKVYNQLVGYHQFISAIEECKITYAVTKLARWQAKLKREQSKMVPKSPQNQQEKEQWEKEKESYFMLYDEQKEKLAAYESQVQLGLLS